MKIWSHKGMTLLEVLLVLGIMSILVLSSFSMFSFSINAFHGSEVRTDLQQNVRLIGNWVGNQVRYAKTLEILSEIPETFDPEDIYIYFQDHTIYLRKGNEEPQLLFSDLGAKIQLTDESVFKKSSSSLLGLLVEAQREFKDFSIDTDIHLLNITTIQGVDSGRAIRFNAKKTDSDSPVDDPIEEGMVWIDMNGDGIYQAGEEDFTLPVEVLKEYFDASEHGGQGGALHVPATATEEILIKSSDQELKWIADNGIYLYTNINVNIHKPINIRARNGNIVIGSGVEIKGQDEINIVVGVEDNNEPNDENIIANGVKITGEKCIIHADGRLEAHDGIINTTMGDGQVDILVKKGAEMESVDIRASNNINIVATDGKLNANNGFFDVTGNGIVDITAKDDVQINNIEMKAGNNINITTNGGVTANNGVFNVVGNGKVDISAEKDVVIERVDMEVSNNIEITTNGRVTANDGVLKATGNAKIEVLAKGDVEIQNAVIEAANGCIIKSGGTIDGSGIHGDGVFYLDTQENHGGDIILNSNSHEDATTIEGRTFTIRSNGKLQANNLTLNTTSGQVDVIANAEVEMEGINIESHTSIKVKSQKMINGKHAKIRSKQNNSILLETLQSYEDIILDQAEIMTGQNISIKSAGDILAEELISEGKILIDTKEKGNGDIILRGARLKVKGALDIFAGGVINGESARFEYLQNAYAPIQLIADSNIICPSSFIRSSGTVDIKGKGNEIQINLQSAHIESANHTEIIIEGSNSSIDLDYAVVKAGAITLDTLNSGSKIFVDDATFTAEWEKIIKIKHTSEANVIGNVTDSSHILAFIP